MKADNTFVVAIFGIPEFERELVERIFSVSESRDHVYRLAGEAENHSADIALVDTTNTGAAEELERFHSEHADLPSVIIANGSEQGSEYWVKRPFTAMRMLGALDRLVQEQLSGTAPPKPTAPSAPNSELANAEPADAEPADAEPADAEPADAEPADAEPADAEPADAEPADAEPTAAPAAAQATEPPKAAGNYKALVVDDSAPVRKQVNFVLRKAGITAEFAEDGESALKLIETREYDILFLDVVLPGKDGYEICKAVKRDKNRKHIPVIMLTAKSSKVDKVKGKLSGCDAYLTKPVSMKEFNQTLSKWLNPPLPFESMAESI